MEDLNKDQVNYMRSFYKNLGFTKIRINKKTGLINATLNNTRFKGLTIKDIKF